MGYPEIENVIFDSVCGRILTKIPAYPASVAASQCYRSNGSIWWWPNVNTRNVVDEEHGLHRVRRYQLRRESDYNTRAEDTRW